MVISSVFIAIIFMSMGLFLGLLINVEVSSFPSKDPDSTTSMQTIPNQNSDISGENVENFNNSVGTSSYNTYKNPSVGIELQYPNTWKILESTDEESSTIVSFIPPGEENAFQYLVTFGINFYAADRDDHLSESLEDTIKLYENNEEDYDNFEIVGQSTITDKIGGYPAYSLTGTYNYDGKDYKIADWGFRVEETEFNFVYDSESQKFEKYYPNIKKMLDSFRLY